MAKRIQATVTAEDLAGKDRDSVVAAIPPVENPLPLPDSERDWSFGAYGDRAPELQEAAEFVTRAEFDDLMEAIRHFNTRSPQRIHV